MNRETANVRRYATEIQYVAGMKARGLVPMILREKHPEEAQKLEVAIDILNEANLMSTADALAQKILTQEKTHKARIPAKSKTTPNPAASIEWQSNFFGEMGLQADPKLLAQIKADLANPERGIDALHNPQKRKQLQQKETNRVHNSWIRFLKDIGALKTWGERRTVLLTTMSDQILLLRQLGIWDEIVEKGLTPEVIDKLRKTMDQPRTYHTDLESSEGVTIFSSPIALALKKIVDSHEI